MNRRAYTSLAVALTVGLCTVSLAGGVQAASSGASKLADYYAREGAMTRTDFLRLNHITIGIERTGTISDQDLTWSLHLLQSPPPQDTPGNRDERCTAVVFRLLELRRVTLPQRRSLRRSAQSLISK